MYSVLTTAVQIGSWEPEISKGFHYKQPDPWWRLLLWLENLDNSDMPHDPLLKKGGRRHRDIEKSVSRGGE